MTAPRILVVTVVHHPLDTRILVRQIAALTAAGHEVTYAAPFAAFGVEPPAGVRALDLPRSSGRHRLSSVRTARQMIRQWAPEHDVVLIHDPELVVAAAGVTDTAVVWDVHEDTAVTVAYKDWIPRGLSRAAAVGVRGMERWAERHFSLLLAESAYAGRFRQPHTVVPNSTLIDAQAPLPGPGRAVCVSTLTRARGALDVIEVGRLLRPQGIVVDVIGPATADVDDALRRADLDGDIRWHGRLPHEEVVLRMRGATAGLSLLHNERNYRHSHPTKVFEYLAHGVPAVATPLPLVADLVERYDAGVIVPFHNPRAAAHAVVALHEDDERRIRLGANGVEAVRTRHNWDDDAPMFVAAIEQAARAGSRGPSSSRRRPARRRPVPPA